MANLRVNLDTAIYNVLNVLAVNNVATGGVFNTMAPPNAKLPYVVFQLISKQDEHSFNGRFGNAVYMAKAISRSAWPKEAATIDTQIDTALEDATLAITGFTQLVCRREQDISYVEERTGELFHHIGGLYRIMADQT